MSLVLELKPEHERQLRERAEANGLPVEDYVMGILLPAEEEPPEPKLPFMERLKIAQERMDQIWRDSGREPMAIPDAAFDRERIYSRDDEG